MIAGNRQMRFAWAGKLRKADWWAENVGKPFGEWRCKAANLAKAAYATAVEVISMAENIDDVEKSVTKFSAFINGKNDIETTEREDIGNAVWKLTQLEKVTALGLDEDKLIV